VKNNAHNYHGHSEGDCECSRDISIGNDRISTWCAESATDDATCDFQAESRNGLGHGSRREVFFLNLEDGYFGCQVNESTDILQLLELSKLCDHHVDCYQGTDEQREKLKCTGA